MSGDQRHWETIYTEKKPTEVSWFQRDPAMSLEWIRSVSLSQQDRVIDVGGGASHLVDRLLEAGYSDVTVLDISEKALQYAKERLGAKSSMVHWIVSDATAFQAQTPYDLWHDRAVFHFLTEKADRERYVAGVRRGLKKGGHLILATFAKDGPDRCSDLPVRQYDADLVRVEFGEGFELIKESSEIHRTPWGKDQKFGYFLLRKMN